LVRLPPLLWLPLPLLLWEPVLCEPPLLEPEEWEVELPLEVPRAGGCVFVRGGGVT
jgi:hypothetical protein